MSEKINEIKEFCDYVLELEKQVQELKDNCERWYEDYHKLRIRNKYEIEELKDKIEKVRHILNNQIDYREFVDAINAIEDVIKE